MKTSPSLAFLLDVAKVQAALGRRFDGRLGGLGQTEFLILLELANAPASKMRRIDLAEAVGLTASGVTRLLAPMEKIGLVKREADAADARVSFVSIAKGGREKLEHAMENAEVMAKDLLTAATKDELKHASALLAKLR